MTGILFFYAFAVRKGSQHGGQGDGKIRNETSRPALVGEAAFRD